ncbi:unnamed protein product [Vitrella brassicaformis CCMP3155]|uniref:MORN repeat-containing protein 3 n=1 Tax=Vitrella brassicaformis (strain CCMP3155) TaxID=1169540 RepID=A0A0G4FNA9_VITBC|nr:unnamed protein product [Vitrella brassicaformis CCMP3155]|eukprot:CEM15735.1 unnamed protein product [Vitrella brassicaformis CCMP3155]
MTRPTAVLPARLCTTAASTTALSAQVGGTEVPHGTGLLRSLDGDKKRYEGEWKDGKYHGKGIEYASFETRNQQGQLETKMCLVYEGDFADGKREGQKGTEYQAINGQMGKVYEGEWRDNKWHGQGRELPHYDSSSGQRQHILEYTGSWVNGKRHGEGEELTDSKVTYRGGWANGEKKGNGTAGGMELRDDNGQHLGNYHGPTLDGQPNGDAELRYGNQVVYKGNWASGKRHGQGKAYYDYCPVLWFDGEWREGLANNGMLFPDGDCWGQKKADGSPVYPIKPIRWQAGQQIPNTDVPGCGWKLHQWLQSRGVSGYFPAGAL